MTEVIAVELRKNDALNDICFMHPLLRKYRKTKPLRKLLQKDSI